MGHKVCEKVINLSGSHRIQQLRVDTWSALIGRPEEETQRKIKGQAPCPLTSCEQRQYYITCLKWELP